MSEISKNYVFVEVSDGSVSETNCVGDVQAIVLDWDMLEIDTAEAREKLQEILDLRVTLKGVQEYIDRLNGIIAEDDDDEDEEEEEEDDFLSGVDDDEEDEEDDDDEDTIDFV